MTFASPGSQGYAVVDLDAGRYGMVCFIPVGTESLDELEGPEGGESPEATASPTGAASPTGTASPPAGGEGEGDGGPPPHFTRGMVAEFSVA